MHTNFQPWRGIANSDDSVETAKSAKGREVRG